MKFRYEDLDVTRETYLLIKTIYQLTKSFPSHEQFGLTSQVRRAAVSILLNIAEGSARGSKADFRRFITTALASLAEVDASVKIAATLSYISEESVGALKPPIQTIWYKLCALRESQKRI